MKDILLSAKNIHAVAEEKEILKGIDLEIKQGETHLLMGPNGAGKSTLGSVLMGNPAFQISEGALQLEGEDITQLKVDERAKRGMFLSFQSPVEVSGVTLYHFLATMRSVMSKEKNPLKGFRKDLKKAMETLAMDESYLNRDLNVGFSGGERKKTEMLQLLMLNPKFAILDETDSGLDVDAVNVVAKGISAYQNENNGMLIITHNPQMIQNIRIDRVHVLAKGKIVKSGGKELAEKIFKDGFEQNM